MKIMLLSNHTLLSTHIKFQDLLNLNKDPRRENLIDDKRETINGAETPYTNKSLCQHDEQERQEVGEYGQIKV